MFDKLYGQLTAIETLGVGRQGPGLNPRAERVLRWLRVRRTREFERFFAEHDDHPTSSWAMRYRISVALRKKEQGQ